MKNLILDLIDTYENQDEFKRQLENYHNFVTGEDGRFVHDVLKTTKMAVVLELLSPRFTKLSAEEKDVQQRTIYQIDLMLDFLMAPMRLINERRDKRSKIYNPKTIMGAFRQTQRGKG